MKSTLKSNLKYLQLFEDRAESLKKLVRLGLLDDATAARITALDWIKAGSVGSLDLEGSGIKSLPDELKRVKGSLNLRNCVELTGLPDGLKVDGSLYLEGCARLSSLPEGLEVGGSLFLNGCARLRRLPNGLRVGDSLWLRLTGVSELPADLEVGQSIFR